MTKEERLERAKKLLAAVEEAMPYTDEIHKTVSQWDADKNPPPLLRSSYSWSEAMESNEEKLKQFETIVHFLTETIFGVDCDNDSVLNFVFIDKSRYQHRLPPFKVPRLPDKSTLKEIMRALDLAKTNAKTAQSVVNGVEVELKFYMEDLAAKEAADV
jgi:hypothetical protein